MMIRKTLALLAVMSAAAAGGAAYAGAQDDSGSGSSGDRSAQQRPDRGPGGCDGPGMHRQGLAALARELGVSRAKLREALNAVGVGDRPDKGDLAADLAQALGVEESAVQEILDENRPDGRRGPHVHGDIVEALASGLNIDEAKVEDALERLHEQRHDEFAAALAEELGLDAADVEEALDSFRPPRP
jgi:Clp amino terminal domain, pathogenicity island component